MSYESEFERLNTKLKNMILEAVKPTVGELNTKDTLQKVKATVIQAYYEFYDKCTASERQLLGIIHPDHMESRVEVNGTTVSVSVHAKVNNS